jgi:hypothetical protein
MLYPREEIGKRIDDRADNDIGGFFCFAHGCGVECEQDDYRKQQGLYSGAGGGAGDEFCQFSD